MNKIKVLLGAVALLFSIGASAAPIAIDTMYVDNATANLTVGPLGPFMATTSITPPAQIIMGSFQSSILSVSSTDYALNIYSTNINGNPAPSGSVDGTTIDVDFSSLRGNLTYNNNNYDFELWPLTTALDYGVYDPVNSTFDIGWSENLVINLNGLFPTNANLEINLQGYLTTVPIPGALWLFGSGMIALFGFSRRKIKL